MKKTMSKIWITALLVVFAVGVAAQQPEGLQPRVAGLEGNAEYMELLGQEVELEQREDSLNSAMAAIRARFRNEPDRIRENAELIRTLENEIFDVRNHIGIISVRVSAIEQEFILSNLDQFTGGGGTVVAVTPNAGAERSDNLVMNPYFADNLPTDDYKALRLAQEREQAVVNYLDIYRANYDKMAPLAAEYAEAHTAEQADTIYNRYTEAGRLNDVIADSIASAWGFVFDNKVYAYNYLLDKLRESAFLREFEEKGLKIRELLVSTRDDVESEAVARYAPQKELLLDYELALAGILGYERSLDSLKRAKSAFDKSRYDFPKIDFKERFFLDYSNIEVANPPKYNARNPIPALKIHERGVIYRVLLGSWGKAMPVTTFRGVYPIGYVKDGNRYSYYAGGFSSQTEASEEAARMRKLGFRDAKTAVWDSGQYSVTEDAPAKVGATDTVYRVEISGAGDGLSEAVRNSISATAPGKDIIRAQDKFIVGPFSSSAEAHTLADALSAADGAISVSITQTQL